MANMKNTIFHHLFPTKAEEEEFQRLSYVPNPEEQSEVVQIRDETPQLLDLFPWEMTKVLDQSDLANFPGLELSRKFVHEHLFVNWNEESLKHVWIHHMGLTIKMRDIDTKTDHDVTFLTSVNVDKYFLSAGWFGNFVERRGLLVGEKIGMYWDTRLSMICFSVLKDASDSLGSSSAVQGGTSWAVQDGTPGSSEAGSLNVELTL